MTDISGAGGGAGRRVGKTPSAHLQEMIDRALKKKAGGQPLTNAEKKALKSYSHKYTKGQGKEDGEINKAKRDNNRRDAPKVRKPRGPSAPDDPPTRKTPLNRRGPAPDRDDDGHREEQPHSGPAFDPQPFLVAAAVTGGVVLAIVALPEMLLAGALIGGQPG